MSKYDYSRLNKNSIHRRRRRRKRMRIIMITLLIAFLLGILISGSILAFPLRVQSPLHLQTPKALLL